VSPLDRPDVFLDAIAFNIDPGIWPVADNTKVLLAFRLDINHFRGRDNLQLMVEHIEVVF
jgi:single-stranded-DNA-specific exonuclease